jgi:hypothetical protein
MARSLPQSLTQPLETNSWMHQVWEFGGSWVQQDDVFQEGQKGNATRGWQGVVLQQAHQQFHQLPLGVIVHATSLGEHPTGDLAFGDTGRRQSLNQPMMTWNDAISGGGSRRSRRVSTSRSRRTSRRVRGTTSPPAAAAALGGCRHCGTRTSRTSRTSTRTRLVVDVVPPPGRNPLGNSTAGLPASKGIRHYTICRAWSMDQTFQQGQTQGTGAMTRGGRRRRGTARNDHLACTCWWWWCRCCCAESESESELETTVGIVVSVMKGW